jgi:hypothetical protein
VDSWPAFASLVAVAPAGHLPTAPTPPLGTGPQEDLSVFLRAYGAAIPRLSLLPMVETSICINLANIYLSSVQMLEIWKNKGRLPEEETQAPLPLFVDCSLSTDHKLRQVSEQSMEQCRRRLSNLSTPLMYLRLLDYEVRYESGIPTDQLPAKAPVALDGSTSWATLRSVPMTILGMSSASSVRSPAMPTAPHGLPRLHVCARAEWARAIPVSAWRVAQPTRRWSPMAAIGGARSRLAERGNWSPSMTTLDPVLRDYRVPVCRQCRHSSGTPRRTRPVRSRR